MPAPDRPASPTAVSMRDVAAAANASRMAVSRAFRAGSSLRPELRARILAAAERLGYRPDPLVTKLMTSFAQRRAVHYRETLAALWWPDRWKQTKTPGSFSANLLSGMEASAQRHGCRIDHLILGKSSASALDRTLATRHIRGVILTPPTTPGSVAPALDWDKLSVMVIGSSLQEPGFNRIHQHHYAAMVNTLHHLRTRGFKRPVLVVRTELNERMQRAYTAAFSAHDAGPPENILSLPSFDAGDLAARLKPLHPDVVIVDTDAWLPLVKRALGRRAARCGLVSLDVEHADGPVSGVFQNAGRMGGCAIDFLVQARLQNETGLAPEPMTILTPGLWVEGESAVRPLT